MLRWNKDLRQTWNQGELKVSRDKDQGRRMNDENSRSADSVTEAAGGAALCAAAPCRRPQVGRPRPAWLDAGVGFYCRRTISFSLRDRIGEIGWGYHQDISADRVVRRGMC